MPSGNLEYLCDAKRCPTPEALEAAFRIAEQDPGFPAAVASALTNECESDKPNLAHIERLLELLAAVAADDRLYPILRAAMSHPDPHVRQKTALVLSRKVQNPEILRQLATDGDPRVRANTVQALWGRQDEASHMLLSAALEDLHHRVAANAAYGLFLLDPAGHPLRLKRFVKHPHPRFRRAGAWLLRKIGDPADLALLQPLVDDRNAEVRASAWVAMVALQQAAAKLVV